MSRRSKTSAYVSTDGEPAQYRCDLVNSTIYIGRESSQVEEVQDQSVMDANAVYTEYPDTRRDEWVTKIQPIPKTTPLSALQRRTGLSRAALQAMRGATAPPEKSTRPRSASEIQGVNVEC